MPDAGINVGLYAVNLSSSANEAAAQAITDARDSCAYITGVIPGAVILADHKNQDFSGLTKVTQGMTGMIVTADSTINLVATYITNGKNTGYGLADSAGNTISAIAPYIAYTCLQDWQNVRIVGFSVG